MNRFVWGFFVLVFSVPVLACRDEFIKVDKLQIQMGFFDQGKTCFLSTHGTGVGLIYRDFILTNKGSMMVFNSFGEGSESTSAGAREFYFFPRQRDNFDFSVGESEPRLKLYLNEGIEIHFSSETGAPIWMNKAVIEVDPKIHRENQGGIEVKNYEGILLDLGFTMGGAPSSRPKQKAVFRDQLGNSCQVVAKEIFDITPDDTEFRFLTDAELKSFLSSRCPRLDLSSLSFN